MTKDLTSSEIDRQNILNNPYALFEIAKAASIRGIPFEGKTIVLKEQVASFFDVTVRAVENDLEPRRRDPRVRKGDFMRSDLPCGFDMILGTAVFEPGSTVSEALVPDPAGQTPALLTRCAELLAPGGYLILENACYPLPFSPAQARTSGFEVRLDPVPSVNPAFGGRGCTLRFCPPNHANDCSEGRGKIQRGGGYSSRTGAKTRRGKGSDDDGARI